MLRLARFYSLAVLVASLAFQSGGAAQSRSGDVRFVVETPEYALDERGLRVPGYALSEIPGAPQLPIWTTVIELPAGAEWTIREVESEERALYVAAPLAPAPSPVWQGHEPFGRHQPAIAADSVLVETRPDPVIYRANSLYPAQVVQAGPEGTARGKRLLPIRVYPFQYNPLTGAMRYRPRIEFTVHIGWSPIPRASGGGVAPLAPSGGASVPGLLVHTVDRGFYRLTHTMLMAAGVPVDTLEPAQLTMWYMGEPIDIEVTGSEDGRFDVADSIIFYAEPYTGRYMAHNVYRLTWSGAGPRVRNRGGGPSLDQAPSTTIRQRSRVEYDRIYYSTYRDLAREADHFFDNPLYANPTTPTAVTTYTLALDKALLTGDAEIRVGVHGGQDLSGANPDQSLLLSLNGRLLGPYQWDGSVARIIMQSVPASSLFPGPNTLALEASLSQIPGIPYYWVSPDWAEIIYPARAEAANNRLYVETVIPNKAATAVTPTPTPPRAPTARGLYLPLLLTGGEMMQGNAPGVVVQCDVEVGEFTEPAIRVYDVSDARRPVLLTGISETRNAGRYSVTFAGEATASYYLTTESAQLAPASMQLDPASDLRSLANAADYIAIVHRSLWDGVQPLLDHRAAEGMRIAKVDVQDVYDEFSGSRVEPGAIRSFLSYAYHNWNGGELPPRYVLLVGDGHFDFRGNLRPDLPNLIPPYLLNIDPFMGETAADNRFVSVDELEDSLPDMAVGRIPAKSTGDVTAVVNKILAYEKNARPGEWQTQVVFVADTKDDAVYDFHALSQEALNRLPPVYQPRTVYYKSSTTLDTPVEMKAAMRSAFDSGALYLQWFGHASRNFWSNDKVWDLSDPAKLAQNQIWPFTAHYSCWTGYFINVQASAQYGNSEQSLGEMLLLTPNRGALVDFSPSGKHEGTALVGLNGALMDALFTQRLDRAGLAVDSAKIAYFAHSGGWLDLIDTQVLFGDPATLLRLP